MNKNIKQVIVILLTLVVGYVIYKLLKAAIFAIIIGAALFIGYNIVNKAINGKKNKEID